MIGGYTQLSIATHRAGLLTLNPNRNPIRNTETLTPALNRNILTVAVTRIVTANLPRPRTPLSPSPHTKPSHPLFVTLSLPPPPRKDTDTKTP